MDLTIIGNHIAEVRKKAGLTREALAEAVGVSVQAVGKWETGRNLPDLENLLRIAEITNTPYARILSEDEPAGGVSGLVIRDRLFHEENMYTRMRSFALTENLEQTYRALHYMRERHVGQFRKPGKYQTEQILYINHPLLMACHAHALGIRDDALLSAILLHDVIEDTGVSADELPFSDEVRQIVSLVSFSEQPGLTHVESKEKYYAGIIENPKACVVKIIDRCNNVSTMARCFSKEKMQAYITETEKYVLPLAEKLKNDHAEYSDVAFLVKYQIRSILETIKYLLV